MLSDKRRPVRTYWNTVNRLRRLLKLNKAACPISNEEWFEYFAKLFNDENDISESEYCNKILIELKDIPLYDPLEMEITWEEIKTVIKKLHNNKAHYIDNVTTEMLKWAGDTIGPFLTALFNMIRNTAIYPQIWTEAYISQLYKKGAKTDPSNYRGIAVSSVVGKVFSSIMNNKLFDFMCKTGLDHEYQGAFKKGSRTTDFILTLETVRKWQLKEGKALFSMYYDLRKAYDTIPRRKLLIHLRNKGLHGKFYKVLEKMLLDTRYRLKISSFVSDPFPAPRGLKQGDVSP